MRLSGNLSSSLGVAISCAVIAVAAFTSSARAQSSGEGFSAPPRTTNPTILPVKPRRSVSPNQNAGKRGKSEESINLGSYPSLRVTLLVFAIQTIVQGIAKDWKDDDAQMDQTVARNRPVLKQAAERSQYRSPNEILRSARALFIRSRSGFFKGEAFEREILKRSEKEKLELVITRDESEADLVVEVYRKRFSTRFVFSVIEPGAKRVLISDKSSSLGGDIEPDLANLLIKRFKAARQ